MAYFKGSKPEEIPYLDVPLHTLLVVRSYGYDFEIETVPLKGTFEKNNTVSSRLNFDCLFQFLALTLTESSQIIARQPGHRLMR